MDISITPAELMAALDGGAPPLLIDVRRAPAFRDAGDMAAGAVRREPAAVEDWAPRLPAGEIVVYCVHGHEVSQGAAAALRARGLAARYLEGGLEEGWKGAGGALDRKPAGASTRWVTRERPRIDRIACPWLISRFIDDDAEFLYVPADAVGETARVRNAVPFDVPGVTFSHAGPNCTFDAFLRHYRLGDPALARLARIVRAADTGAIALAPEAHGLLAISHGLSRLHADDHAMLAQAFVVYDALHAWCGEAAH